MALSSALFISDTPQQRTVKLQDGSEHVLHFKQLPAADFRKFFNDLNSANDSTKAQAMAWLISASLCEPDGKPALTVKQAMVLTPSAEKAISDAVLDVNGLGEKQGKD